MASVAVGCATWHSTTPALQTALVDAVAGISTASRIPSYLTERWERQFRSVHGYRSASTDNKTNVLTAREAIATSECRR